MEPPTIHLFYGPPGCGKTLEARQLAEQLKAEHGWEWGRFTAGWNGNPRNPIRPIMLIDEETRTIGMSLFCALVGTGSQAITALIRS